jgi:hypothetical protein
MKGHTLFRHQIDSSLPAVLFPPILIDSFPIAKIPLEAPNEIGIHAVEALSSQCVPCIQGTNLGYFVQAFADKAIFAGLSGVYETRGKGIKDQAL